MLLHPLLCHTHCMVLVKANCTSSPLFCFCESNKRSNGCSHIVFPSCAGQLFKYTHLLSKPLRYFCNEKTQTFLQFGVRDILRSHVKSKKSEYQEWVIPFSCPHAWYLLVACQPLLLESALFYVFWMCLHCSECCIFYEILVLIGLMEPSQWTPWWLKAKTRRRPHLCQKHTVVWWGPHTRRFGYFFLFDLFVYGISK